MGHLLLRSSDQPLTVYMNAQAQTLHLRRHPIDGDCEVGLLGSCCLTANTQQRVGLVYMSLSAVSLGF